MRLTALVCGNHPIVVPRAIGAQGAGLYLARVTATTPHMFYSEIVGADNQAMPLLPNLAPEAAG